MLDVDSESIKESDTFTGLGGSSIDVLSFTFRLNEVLSVEYPADEIFVDSGLATVVETCLDLMSVDDITISGQ